jgi:hypothetical protein
VILPPNLLEDSNGLLNYWGLVACFGFVADACLPGLMLVLRNGDMSDPFFIASTNP